MRLRSVAVWFLPMLAAMVLGITAQAADVRRIALVIGNAEYREGALRNPVNDARAMTAALTEHGFSVILRLNATKSQMEEAIAEFGEQLGEGGTALFYFAGHGIQVNGRNFLIPVDAEIRSEPRVRLTTVDVEAVLDQMGAARSRVNIVILDACRNNPFERRFRGTGGGLAQMNAPEGTLIAYATAPGAVAADGTGANGLYTEELLRAIREPGLKVEEVFKSVRAGVTRRSNGAQIPWESSSLVGDFYFRELQPAMAAGPSPLSARQALELALWDAVKTSQSAAELQAYLDQFPNGTFAPLARTRIAAMAVRKGAPEPPVAIARPPESRPRTETNPPVATARPASIADATAIPGLSKPGREAYQRFLASGEHRAFAVAVAKGAGFGWTAGNEDANRAVWSAAYNCTKSARSICQIHALNQSLEAASYERFARESAEALAVLRPGAVQGYFRDENRDFGVPPQDMLRPVGYHADTPLTLPGARTIYTTELLGMLASGTRPVLVDTLDGNHHRTLPGAYWMRGAGNVKAEGDETVSELLGRVTGGLAASKATPVIVFCLSSQCWLSYNAARRLVLQGYNQVYWYRGGVEAWRAAGLPMVRSVIHAQF
ncbi:MAG: caspase family protein [Alphaproteobacteria bacterium]|nr:caspase family protein [Alphaproteobacteria bacterium]